MHNPGNDGVIFEEDADEDEYMFTGEGMLNTIKINLQHYNTTYQIKYVVYQIRVGQRSGN